MFHLIVVCLHADQLTSAQLWLAKCCVTFTRNYRPNLACTSTYNRSSFCSMINLRRDRIGEALMGWLLICLSYRSLNFRYLVSTNSCHSCQHEGVHGGSEYGVFAWRLKAVVELWWFCLLYSTLNRDTRSVSWKYVELVSDNKRSGVWQKFGLASCGRLSTTDWSASRLKEFHVAIEHGLLKRPHDRLPTILYEPWHMITCFSNKIHENHRLRTAI